jgi:protein-export membrane protein SecD
LAGLAGFILSVGMAVDANILIFERAKEEYREGKNIFDSYLIGFDRAWSSIRDSNSSSIITGLILFWFGTGSIRGFALVLIIGVIISMFTAITVSRTLLLLITKSRLIKYKFLFALNRKKVNK